MNRMVGIILMIIGILIFVVGIVLYISSKKINEQKDNNNELEKVIKMAIADGVLTGNERKIIKQITIEKELDYNKIIKGVEKQISELEIDSETELIDHRKKKGDDFEKFIVQKFNQKYYRIKEWAGDKYVNGVYADTTPQPDLLLEFHLGQKTAEFSVECKWRQNLYKGGVEFAKKEQFNRYKNFEKKRKIPVFVAIGIGGKAASPEKLYVVPLQEIDSNFIHIKELKKYEKKVENKFFFDIKTKELK